MPTTLQALQERITAAVTDIDGNMLLDVWTELDYRWDVCRVTKDARIEHL
ncbi:Tyrosine-protein phosphatase non-receptor type 4, partial [Araneus ventricosus]